VHPQAWEHKQGEQQAEGEGQATQFQTLGSRPELKAEA